MKTLKIKFGLFSLLVVLGVSVFLTSCEQENMLSESPVEVSPESAMIFTLPDEMNGLSDEVIIEYIQGLSDEEITNLSVAGNDELESRSCSWWRDVYVSCRPYWSCEYGKKEYILQRCGYTNYHRWVWGNCCQYYW